MSEEKRSQSSASMGFINYDPRINLSVIHLQNLMGARFWLETNEVFSEDDQLDLLDNLENEIDALINNIRVHIQWKVRSHG